MTIMKAILTTQAYHDTDPSKLVKKSDCTELPNMYITMNDTGTYARKANTIVMLTVLMPYATVLTFND